MKNKFIDMIHLTEDKKFLLEPMKIRFDFQLQFHLKFN